MPCRTRGSGATPCRRAQAATKSSISGTAPTAPGMPAAHLARERLERRLAAVAEDEVVRRRPQRRADDRAPVLDEPQLVLGVEAGFVAQRPGEAEDQVVPRLVREQRRGALEELGRVGRAGQPPRVRFYDA